MTNGELIKKLRKQHNLTQEQLGGILGVKKSAIQKYESGDIKNLKLETIRKICITFNVPAHVFIYERGYGMDDFAKLFETEEIQRVARSFFGLEKFTLFKYLLKLNNDGIRKVLAYTSDIIEIPRYTK